MIGRMLWNRNWPDPLPSFSVIGTPFDPASPGMIALDRTSAHHGSILKYQRFSPNRAIQACRKMLYFGPALAVVVAPPTSRSPAGRVRPELVIKPKPPIFRMKHHGVIAGDIGFPRH